MESLGSDVAVKLSKVDEFDFGSKNRNHRTSTFATCWAGKRAFRKYEDGKAATRGPPFFGPERAPAEKT